MISDFLDESTGIVNVTLSGNISIEEMTSWIDSLTPSRIPLKSLRLLDDATQANYTFSPEEIKNIDITIGKLCNRYERVRVAIVHAKARETAFSNLIIKEIKAVNYLQKIFSERENALRWLLSMDGGAG